MNWPFGKIFLYRSTNWYPSKKTPISKHITRIPMKFSRRLPEGTEKQFKTADEEENTPWNQSKCLSKKTSRDCVK